MICEPYGGLGLYTSTVVLKNSLIAPYLGEIINEEEQWMRDKWS